jgi:hypothetical protein
MPSEERLFHSMERRAAERRSNWRDAIQRRDVAARLLKELDGLLAEWQTQIQEYEADGDDAIADGVVFCHARLRQVIDDYRKAS